MYVSGFILLVIGFALCLSIAWAPIGFFAMSFGLICLLIAEKRSKASKLRLQKSARPSKQPRPPTPTGPAANTEVRQGFADERAKWRLLVDGDPELASVERVLSQYGPQYVDQLARVYLVFDNKAFLPIILKMIVESARLKHEGPQRNAEYPSDHVEDRERRQVNEIAISDPQPSRSEINLKPQTESELAKRVDEAPAPGGAFEPISQAAMNLDETDGLRRLFDELMSSRS